MDEIDTGNSTLTDPESLETLKNLHIHQLVQPPTIDEIYGKSTTHNYKTMFLDNLTEEETPKNIGNGEIKH